MTKEILRTTNPRLREKSKPVQKVDKKLLTLLKNLEDTLKAQKDPEGVGLAAPQLGVLLQVFLIQVPGEKPMFFINPQILSRSKKTNDPVDEKGEPILEGCLSLPHYYGPVQRANSITVKYQTPVILETGDWKLETFNKSFTGFLSQAIQHEVDHLKGIIFVDHLLSQKRKLYQQKGKDWHEVELI